MNVLLIGPSNDRVELHLMQALHEHSEIELRVIVVPDSPAVERCAVHEIPFQTHHFTGRIDRAGRDLIEAELLNFKPDIVHALTNRGLSNTLLARKKTKSPPQVIAYRGTSGHLSWFDPAAWMSYLNPRVDKIVCVSDAVRRYLRSKGVPDRRLIVIHKGHDPAWYEDFEQVPRATFGIPDDARIVGFIGNMRPVKGVDVLINALHHLPAELNAHLLLIGGVRDPRLEPLAEHPAIRDRVHFTGQQENPATITGLFDLATMPSISREGLPKGLIECMARRIPCVASDVGGMPELIEHEVSGLIVPPKDPKALAGAIQKLLEDDALRKQIGEAGRQRIEGPFNIAHTVEKTLNLYRTLLT